MITNDMSKHNLAAFNAILNIDIQISEMFFKVGVVKPFRVGGLREEDRDVIDELAKLLRRREEEKR